MNSLLRKLLWLVQRRRKEEELNDELQFHLDEEVAERQGEGAGRDDARLAAQRDLGNLTLVREDARAAWGWTFAEQLAQDLRYGLRAMRKHRIFTLLAALSLALGIGANTAIYSFLDMLLMRSLPVSHPASLVVINWHAKANVWKEDSVVKAVSGSIYPDRKFGSVSGIFPYPAFELLQKQSSVFSSVFAYCGSREARTLNLTVKRRAEIAHGQLVSGDYFRGLAIRPAAGRMITTDDDRLGAAAVAVISYGLSQKRFGGPGNAAGQNILINNLPFTVIGVTPPGNMDLREAHPAREFSLAPRRRVKTTGHPGGRIFTMRVWKIAAGIIALSITLPWNANSEDVKVAKISRSQAKLDRNLLEVTIPQLEYLYSRHKYAVTKVVSWYIQRIKRYNGIYGAIEDLDEKGALATAAREDADAKAGGRHFIRGPMWGVPIVIKENTSVRGLITSDGWKGYKIPGHELIAPRDATIVARLRAAGAVILGKTNMPDFAASDTNRSTAYGRTGNAYDVRFSPGGSSGGTVTAVTGNFALLGNGTDTGNSIRMPAATSAVVGVFPTRGLVSIAGIAPLDWLLDNTGPIARNIEDAAIALTAMAGEDPMDPATIGSAGKAQAGPYTKYLKRDSLKGKRFGVPAFILAGAGIPFEGIPSAESAEQAAADRKVAAIPLCAETRAAFMNAIEALKAAGATVVFDDGILPDSFSETVSRVGTQPYIREGTEKFLAAYGPTQYHSAEEYEKAVGSPLPATIIGGAKPDPNDSRPVVIQVRFENNPQAAADVLEPRKRALELYDGTLDRFHLDGYVYPAIQMPPVDETMPQNGVLSTGPHSDTGWVNMIGVPAVVVPAGFYPNGLPFGLEISTRRWHDGDLLGWAYAYEQATRFRRPPVLVEEGLLSIER